MSDILLIDDDAAVRELLRQILEQAGYKVADAKDGVRGIRLTQRLSPKLVITDMLMPEADGIEVIMQIRESHPDVKIVAISGGGRGLDAHYNLDVAKDFGAQGVLGKPFSRKEVLDLVGSLLSEV